MNQACPRVGQPNAYFAALLQAAPASDFPTRFPIFLRRKWNGEQGRSCAHSAPLPAGGERGERKWRL